MGCATSKLDDSPALLLCRYRCSFLDEAVRHRFALSEAHLAYIRSLKAVGVSIQGVFSLDSDESPPSPLLNLPAHRKGDHPPPNRSESHSDSDSHLHFQSDDEDSSDSDHHDVSQHHLHYGEFYGNLNVSYMKREATPSVVHTQPPMAVETMQMRESSSFYPDSVVYSKIDYSFPNFSSSNNIDNSIDPNFGSGSGFLGEFSSLPPPPPPSSSAWEFLNPFESYERSYLPYTSREIREEDEGIRELENRDDEVVKKVRGDQKFVDSVSDHLKDEGAPLGDGAELQHRSRTSEAKEDGPRAFEVCTVDKKVSGAEVEPKHWDNAIKGDLEVIRMIRAQFERASESGNELAEFLEAGKLPYKRQYGVHVRPSLPSLSKSYEDDDPSMLEIDHEVELRSIKLSSTLHKLYLWEKKLYEEVKVEEKMRVLHDQKTRKLKRMDERGAEAHKVDTTRALLRSLSTKIRIGIQVVDKISVKINGLRDDELWPQLNELIRGLTRMWKSMLECHQLQRKAISEAKQLDAIAFRKHFNEFHFEATLQLEHDIINWTLRFSYWVDAQKCYVRALNNWLMKCLLYVPEETADGIAPFSPSRIGAPLVFVVCNWWCQSLDRISQKEVIDSMRDLASNVLELWDRKKVEMRPRMLGNRDERKVKRLDKEDKKIQKEIQALGKRMDVMGAADDTRLTGHGVVYPSETVKGGSLQASLQHVLETMERFTANSVNVYEELLRRIEETKEEGRLGQLGQEKVSKC